MFTALRVVFVAILSIGALQVVSANPVGFVQTNLASDQMGVAQFTDTNLVNPWGIAASASSPFWLGVNGSGVSLLYNGAGVQQGLIVTIPGEGSVTGVAFSNVAGNFNGDAFLFASEDGAVSGWRGALGTAAETLVLPSDNNSYKGLTDASVGGNTPISRISRLATWTCSKAAPARPTWRDRSWTPTCLRVMLPSTYLSWAARSMSPTQSSDPQGTTWPAPATASWTSTT
jgi:hypothetical protein